MPSPVKNYSSLSSAANVLSGTAGSLQAIMRACLVTGYGSKAVQTLVIAAGIATLTYSTAHAYWIGGVLRVTGAGLAAVNGEKPVLSTSTTTVTFAVPGAPDGAVSGSISTDVAPAGWSEVFTAGAISVFKPNAPEATGVFLRVDDSGTTNARVRAYESMTDANSGVGPTPLESQMAGGLYWSKSGAASALARPWYLVADSRGFYLAVSPQGTDRYTLFYAGDIASFKSGDAYSYLLVGNQSDQNAATTVPDGCCGYSHRSVRNGAYLVRAHTGVGQSVSAQRIGSHHVGTTADAYAGTAGYGLGAYPNGPNNGLMTGALELFAAAGMRGSLPGLLHPVQDCGNAFATGAVVEGSDDLMGRKLLALRVAPPTGAVVPGTVFIDLTGFGGR